MKYKGLNLLKVRIERGVAFVTIDNPPINVLSTQLLIELARFALEVEKDDDVRVIVFDSADPDFFIAHFDVVYLKKAPNTSPRKPKNLTGMHPILEKYRTMPKVSIAKIEGICRGGGSEFVLALDMRFGAVGKTLLAQPEIFIGIIPGGGATQRLPRLIGRSRAMEVILGGRDFSAELAERYGYINRALPPEELAPFVEDLAYRIVSFPAESLALAKKSVLNAEKLPLIEGLIEESHIFNQSLVLPVAKERMKVFLELGGQTREIEIESSLRENEFNEKLEKLHRQEQ